MQLSSSLFETHLSSSLCWLLSLRRGFALHLSGLGFLLANWDMPLSCCVIELPSAKLALHSVISCFIGCLSNSCCLTTTFPINTA